MNECGVRGGICPPFIEAVNKIFFNNHAHPSYKSTSNNQCLCDSFKTPNYREMKGYEMRCRGGDGVSGVEGEMECHVGENFPNSLLQVE